MPCSTVKFISSLEEHIIPIFRVEEKAKASKQQTMLTFSAYSSSWRWR
jgi:hypothetical protein